MEDESKLSPTTHLVKFYSLIEMNLKYNNACNENILRVINSSSSVFY